MPFICDSKHYENTNVYSGGFSLAETSSDSDDDETERVETSVINNQAVTQTVYRRGRGRTSKKDMLEHIRRQRKLNQAK